MSRDDVIIEAFTSLAPRYEEVVDSELRRFWGWSYRGLVRRLIETAAVREGDAVLDVATGTALIPRTLADQIGVRSRIVGLDITLAMLEHAQRALEARKSPSRISLVCASAMGMPFAEESFDVVICGLGAHHMDVPGALCEMRRVLRPGGNLALAIGSAPRFWKLPGIKALLRMVGFLYFLPSDGLARAWAEAGAVSNFHTADEWRAALSESGFTEVRITERANRRLWYPTPLLVKATKAPWR